MCYNLGAAAAATTAPAPEPEPEPPLPRLPGRPRARHALSPPPPRARPALDAVSAAARLPPAPLLSPSQAEPSPAGSGSGGQGARGRRSVWSQRGRRRKSWRKEGKPPPPPRSGDLGARAPLARDRASGPWPAPRPSGSCLGDTVSCTLSGPVLSLCVLKRGCDAYDPLGEEHTSLVFSDRPGHRRALTRSRTGWSWRTPGPMGKEAPVPAGRRRMARGGWP
nr:uncharacterized protein LOC132437706 [Delphinus delphis]